MATITSLNASDAGSVSRGVINTNFSNLNSDKAETSALSAYLNKSTETLDNISAGTTNKHLTATLESKLNGIEANADVTDATNVAAAGALMDSEVTNLAAVKSFDPTDYAPALGADDNYVTDAEKIVIGNTSGTNTGDNAVNSNYSSLVTNATHTGDVTGSGALTVDKTAITGKTAVTALGTDYVLISDTSDSGNLKKALLSDVAGGAPEGTAVLSTGETGGSKFLREDGDGTCSWQTVSGSGTPGGSDTCVQFNDGGTFGGNDGLVYNKTTKKLTVVDIEATGEASFLFSNIFAPSGADSENGDDLNLEAGQGGTTVGNGGSAYLYAGNAQAGDSNGGDIIIRAGSKSGTGTNGKIYLTYNGGSDAVINTESLTQERTFTFPNATGTIVLDSNTQTLTNKTLTSPKINEDVALTSTATELNRLDGINSLTGVLRADAGALSVDTDVTDIVSSASTTVAGKIECAIASEVTTGTSASLAVTPDALAGSDYGKRVVQVMLNGATALTTSDKAYFRIPSVMNGWNLVGVAAMCQTASSSGTPTFTIKNGATSMLSTNLTIDASETDSSTAATAAVINTAEDDVATGNQIEVACTTAGTGTAWVVIELQFQLP